MTDLYTLYGMAGSLYTARPRAYMRGHGVPFTEVKAGGTEFIEGVVPKIGRWIIPVLKTPEGKIIQDGADIIDHLDAQGFSKTPIYPSDPILLAVAHLFELFGSHGLLRPAMHYRWNFDDVNLPFLRHMFRDALPSGLPPEALSGAFDNASGRMRKAATLFGVNPDTFGRVEDSYTRFLALMQDHLSEHPFMLGGHPTIADYGLIGSLYAHLGRDPAPLHLMQRTAPAVFRWTERLNMAETFRDEITDKSDGALITADAMPESLTAIMRFIAEDYLPEITAHVDHANAWLAKHPEITGGSAAHDPTSKVSLGMAKFAWQSAEIATIVIPYRFYLLQRLQDAAEQPDPQAQSAISGLFNDVGLAGLLDHKTIRRIERHNNQEVWGELSS